MTNLEENINCANRMEYASRGNKLIEVKSGLKAIRSFITAIAELAFQVSSNQKELGVLILNDTEITKERLKMESEKMWQILRPDVIKRLRIALVKNGNIVSVSTELEPELKRLIGNLTSDFPKITNRLHRSDYHYMLLEILVHQWLTNGGPMTSRSLREKAGCSYPTVATTLNRLGSVIKRHSDRRVELRHFPKEEWAKLVIVADRIRSTNRFGDRSGRPRSAEDLFRRFRKLKRTDIAVGGTFGAKHYYPNIDLFGNPRLDLSIHAPGEDVNLSFVEDLDPALHKVEDPQEPTHLVLHFVRRKAALFESGANGLSWADPVGCLLDLHDARLEPQALEFLNHLISLQGKKRE